jgi:hypothetical protein
VGIGDCHVASARTVKEPSRRRLGPLRVKIRNTHAEHNRSALILIADIDELGYSLGKQLKALSPDFKSSIDADVRDVATRPRNARYNSLTNRISGDGDNRNCAR